MLECKGLVKWNVVDPKVVDCSGGWRSAARRQLVVERNEAECNTVGPWNGVECKGLVEGNMVGSTVLDCRGVLDLKGARR